MKIRSVVLLNQFVSVQRWLTIANPAFQGIFFETTFVALWNLLIS